MGMKFSQPTNGKEAIILYSNHKEEIKVVLMDMMMQLWTGRRAYSAAQD